MLIEARITFDSCIFREIMITACWVFWTSRNGAIFDNRTPSMQSCKANFEEELGMVCIKAKQK
jgi:hypothetical protein